MGKSYTVEEFARKHYATYLLIDFSVASKEVKGYFENYLQDLDTLFMYLQAEYDVKLMPGESLVIFDEIQRFPRAREAIKTLVADGRYDYIETGSLISIKENVKDILIPSEEEEIVMRPMDLEEFLWAMGDGLLYDAIRDCYASGRPMGALHRKAMDAFKQYMIVGGMPQAVAEYAATRDFVAVDRVKRGILKLYTEDIHKYGGRDALKAEEIFETIPSQLQHRWKKFTLAELGEQARMREYAEAFYWLADSGVVNVVRNATEPNVGLRLTADDNVLKCYMADTGLLIAQAFDEKAIDSEEIYRKILFGKLALNEGMILENMVAQMLAAAGNKLYFYTNNSAGAERMEIDFLLRKSKVTLLHNVLPIEVKSGKNYTLSSLKKYIRKYKQYAGTAYMIHEGDLRTEMMELEGMDGNGVLRHELRYLPVYMAGSHKIIIHCR